MSTEKKKLTLLDATLMVMGGIIGVGIFFNPQRIARDVPEPWAYLGLWLFGGLIAMCAAFTFAELGGSFPKAGGWFVYLREAFGPLSAFLFAWVVLLVISTGAIASIAKFCAQSLHTVFPAWVGERGAPSQLVVSAGLIVLVTLVALSGVKRAALLQNACMLTKLVVIAALILGGLVFMTHQPGATVAVVADPQRPLWKGMLGALLPVFFTYGGWQLVGYIAPEVREPERTLPRAIVLGVLGVIVVYLAANASFLAVLGMDGLAQDERFASTLARASFGPAGERWLAAGMAVSAFGICAVNIITAPWLYVAMARERLFFRSVGELSPRTGVPQRALLIQAGLAFFYVFSSLDYLVDYVVFVEWMFHLLAALALLVLRASRPELARPFRSPLYPLAPLVYLATALLIVGGTLYQAEPRIKYTGLAVLLAGALIYRPWRALVVRTSAGGA